MTVWSRLFRWLVLQYNIFKLSTEETESDHQLPIESYIPRPRALSVPLSTIEIAAQIPFQRFQHTATFMKLGCSVPAWGMIARGLVEAHVEDVVMGQTVV